MKQLTNNQLAVKVDHLSDKTDGLASLIRANTKRFDRLEGRFDELMDFLREHMVTHDHHEKRLGETKHEILAVVDRRIANHTHKTA